MTRPRMLFDGDTFTRGGYTFRVLIERDNDIGEPWKEYDGHGPVSEWTTRAKGPGERVLNSDRGSKRYYDIAEATKIARRDGWGCEHTTVTEADGKRVVSSGHKTRGEAIACAVERDYNHLRAWCEDRWYYVSVGVVHVDDGEDGEREYLGGVSSEDDAYIADVADELADQIIARLEVDNPDVQLSEN